jgi:hypothetical protein
VQQRGRPITFIEPSSAVMLAVWPRLRAVAVKCSAAGEGLARLFDRLRSRLFLQHSKTAINKACARRNAPRW